MGRCEEATLYVGISIEIKELLSLMTEENYKEIRNSFLCYKSVINDSNSSYNDMYNSIINGEDFTRNDYYVDLSCYDYKEYKEYLLKDFTLYGSCKILKYEEDNKENLYHQNLMVPFNKIITTERWGYSRDGTNGSCCDLNINSIAEYKEEIENKMKNLNISGYSIVFILSQHAG